MGINKYFAAADEEDRLDKELETELKTNLLGVTQIAIKSVRKKCGRQNRRLAKLLEALHAVISCRHMQSTIRGETR